ncbi:hypothetical protein [Facilibium subflavum]|uniref:hypothetical protein n=1 Tax=Facilibium subflavum TaxID=2219058 RepID=UPI000E65215D|nr:hypothetical protein [Facilibium subflavum]
MDIDEILKTEAGAKALKAKMKAMSEKEKQKPNYQILWKKICAAVDHHNLKKMSQKHVTESTEGKKPDE